MTSNIRVGRCTKCQKPYRKLAIAGYLYCENCRRERAEEVSFYDTKGKLKIITPADAEKLMEHPDAWQAYA